MNPSNYDPTNPTPSSANMAGADVASRPSAFEPPTGATPGPAHEAAAKGRRTARVVLSQAKDTVGRVAVDQKDMAADRVGGYGSAFRKTARTLEGEDPNIAHFANQAADRIDAVADYIRNSDFSRLRQDAEGVARRHPALFMGGMLVAGLILGNLAKASGQELRGQGNGRGFDDNPDLDDEPDSEAQDFASSTALGGRAGQANEGLRPESASAGF